ncbi:MAG: hypothetical protein ACFFAU_17055 [Candidatus Hodarchaeota archaeon]
MRPFAKGILGLNNDWNNIHGTSNLNHGFDMLFGSRYVFNTADQYAGLVRANWNQGLLMRGYYINPNLMRTIDQTLGTMHETLHTFSCDHVPYFRYIMSGFFGDYIMHSQTVGEIDLSTYDGV